MDCRERHVVGQYRLGQAFQGKLADLFGRRSLFDSNRDSLSNEDLSVLRLGAQPCGEIAYSADRGVAGAVRESDLTERCVALGDTSAESEHSTTSAPSCDQCARRLAHRHCHLDRAFGWVGAGYGIVKEHHDPVPRELIERALVLGDKRSQRTVVLAQEIEHFLRLRGFGEGGVAAQIAKHDDDLTALWLPESPRLLAAKANLAPHHHALLQRLDIPHTPGEAQGIDIAQGNPIRMVFGEGYALQTTLQWIIFFCSLLNLFLFIFWLPEVLHLIGMTPAQAVFATSLYPLGGIFAVLYLGWAIDRFGTRRSLAVHYAAGIVFIALISLVAMPYFALLVVVLLAGVTVLGSQTGLNGACGKLYPARVRTSG